LKTQLAYISSYLGFASYQTWLKHTASKDLGTLPLVGTGTGVHLGDVAAITIEELSTQLNALDTRLLIFSPIGDFSKIIDDLRHLEYLGFEPTIISPSDTDSSEDPQPWITNPFRSSDIITYPYYNSQWDGDYYQNKTVLITGAGGSIGSKLALKCTTIQVKSLILLDHSETAIFKLKEELANVSALDKIIFSITDIRDSLRLEQLLSKHRVDVIFHLAAHKHVGLMEEDPYASFMVNVVGTQLLFDTACNHDVKHFNFVSTDKSVNPISVMGLSKRMAELYLLEQEQTWPKVNILRFGNILGSSGSVLQNFESAIRKCHNLTITHKQMNRYFVLVEDIIRFMLNAPVTAAHKDTLVFDVQKATSILKLAETLILLKKQEHQPVSLIEYGTKPEFEKLDETLFWKEETIIPTQNDQVKRVPFKGNSTEMATVISQIKQELRNNQILNFKDLEALMKHTNTT